MEARQLLLVVDRVNDLVMHAAAGTTTTRPDEVRAAMRIVLDVVADVSDVRSEILGEDVFRLYERSTAD